MYIPIVQSIMYEPLTVIAMSYFNLRGTDRYQECITHLSLESGPGQELEPVKFKGDLFLHYQGFTVGHIPLSEFPWPIDMHEFTVVQLETVATPAGDVFAVTVEAIPEPGSWWDTPKAEFASASDSRLAA